MEARTIAAYAGAVIGILGVPSAIFTAKGVFEDLHVKDLNQKIMLCEVQKIKEHVTAKKAYTDDLECYRKVLGIQ